MIRVYSVRVHNCFLFMSEILKTENNLSLIAEDIGKENARQRDLSIMSPAVVADFEPPLLPIQLLVRPLEVRLSFAYIISVFANVFSVSSFLMAEA